MSKVPVVVLGQCNKVAALVDVKMAGTGTKEEP